MNPAHCIDCPHHDVIPDPDPHDSFCGDDQAVVCTKTANPSRDVEAIYLADRSAFRAVTKSCRPYRLRKESERPAWCPMEEGQ